MENGNITINMENGNITTFTTMVHEMKMDGHHLVERKQRKIYDIDGRSFKINVLIHSRSVDDRSYSVSEARWGNTGNWFIIGKPDSVNLTQMTQAEVEKFEEDWINLWKPEIDGTFF